MGRWIGPTLLSKLSSSLVDSWSCFIDLGFSVKLAAYTTEVGGAGTTYCSRSRSKLAEDPFWVRLGQPNTLKMIIAT